jgi:amino acid transporter
MENMDTGNLVFVMIIMVCLGFFAMIFGIVYLSKRERMAMIERGMDPRRYKPQVQTAPQYLKWGLLLIGSGIGLFLAYVLDYTVFTHFEDGSPAIYFSLIAIGGGLGLFTSYRIEKKEAGNASVNQE